MKMELTIPYTQLVPSLLLVANACPSTSTNPSDLQPFVLFEFAPGHLVLTGQNADYQLSVDIPLEGSEYSQTFLVSGLKVREFFKCLGEQDDLNLQYDTESGFLEVKSGQGQYSLRTRDMSGDVQYAKFEDEGELSLLSIASPTLAFMLNKTLFCVSHENYRDYLKGVRFEGFGKHLDVICLDGHRMAFASTELKSPVTSSMSFSLRAQAAKELVRHLPDNKDVQIEVRLSQNMVTVHVGGLTFKGRLLMCNYPNVRAVLPKSIESKTEVDLALFKSYLGRVSGFSNNRLNNVTFTFTQDRLQMMAKNTENEIGQASMAAQGTPGLERTVNLNADYMKAFAGEMVGTGVCFSFTPPYANTLLTPVGAEEAEVDLKYMVSQIVV